MISPLKRCPKCGETKDRAADFGRRRNGYARAHCRECERAATLSWNKRNPEKVTAANRRGALKRYFGLTEQQYDDIAAAQGGACRICGVPASDAPKGRLVVDHCHDTGRIRGLLCTQCNTGIGMFADAPERLLAAVQYLADNGTGLPELYAAPAMPSGRKRAPKGLAA